MAVQTFPDLLAAEVRRSGARPLVTFYDDGTGERVELSVVTFANWVAKTAGMLQDELNLERGDTVLVDLPTHWLTPVWLGACWSAGLAVTTVPEAGPALVVCGPQGVEHHTQGDCPVVALSLLPMGRPFVDPLPPGVIDFGVTVWGQPDAFVPYDPPRTDDLAWVQPDRTQAELLRGAAEHPWGAPGTRLLTDLTPTSAAGVDAFLGPLSSGGGTVWVRHPHRRGWDRRAETEQVTAVRRTDQPA